MNENQVPNLEDANNTMKQNNISGVNPNINPNTEPPMINPNVSSVPPIAEVKVEETNSITVEEDKNQEMEIAPVSNDGSNIKPSSEPPKNSKASTILLVLLFVFLFAFIMGMPYIRTFIDELKTGNGLSDIEKAAIAEEERQKQEEESKKQSTTKEEKLKELTCTSTSNTVGNYTLVETQTFYYNSKNKVLSSKTVSAYTFTTIDDSYNSLKQQCDENSLKYATHEGFTMGCSYDEVNIEISHEFDLETFKPIVDEITNIQANTTYQQDLNTIKTDLTSKGYTCQ